MTSINFPSVIHIYTDGGSRGNPGPSACAYCALSYPSRAVLSKDSAYLGIATNNASEYRGIIMGLKWLAKVDLSLVSGVTVYSDSELIVNQINGKYRIKNLDLINLHRQLSDILAAIKSQSKILITFVHIPRSQNSVADGLVNQNLDQQYNSGS